MNKQILCLGLDHRTAPVMLRERLTFAPHLIDESLCDHCLHDIGLTELVIVSTCNRVELYVSANETSHSADVLFQRLRHFIAATHDVPEAEFDDHLYYYTNMDAAEHLFRVASGLDSLILGEPQILGQVNDSFARAQAQKWSGPVLNALFQTAVATGKRARTETQISSNPASISSVAITLAKNIVGDLSQKHILIIGAGEMAQLAFKALQSRGVGQITFANRTCAHVQNMADQCGGTILGLDELLPALSEADVVISATGAPHFVLTPELVTMAIAQRPFRALVLIDVAVPRDVAPEVSQIEGVHLFDVDNLQGNLDEALAARQAEIPKVEAIIAHEMAVFEQQLRQLTVRPVIKDLHTMAEEIRQRELDRTRRFARDIDPESWAHIEHLTQSLINKLLHEPTRRLRAEATNGHANEYAETLRYLFALEESV